MSCAQIALNRANIQYDKYYASEIYEPAIHITQKNYPDTIQLGDITKLNDEELSQLPKIHLIVGGSPCQNLSISVINNQSHNQGLDGDKSRLFYEYVRVLRWIKKNNNPNVLFMLENVASMKTEDKDIITEVMGIEPLRINSNLVSAQDRDRYYWTNINVGDMPKDKGIVLEDIVLEPSEVEDKYWYKDKDFILYEDWENKKVIGWLDVKTHESSKRIYSLNNKCGTLTACRGGYRQKKIMQNNICRKLTPLEYERLQTVPEDFTYGVADSHRYNMLGDGWTIDIVSHIFSYIKL